MKKVLLCRPTHFDVSYEINPWMKKGSVNKQLAMKQWEHLADTYRQYDVQVKVINQQQGLPDMVFATDQGVVNVKQKHVLLSNFRHPERQPESHHYKQWFLTNGYTVEHTPTTHYFESNGESYFWNNIVFLGVGMRSTHHTATFLTKKFRKKVIPLHIIDPRFYHLDVGFFPLNNTTVFYYPPAYTKDSQEQLKKYIPHLIEFTKDEAEGFAANSVVVHNKYVIMQKNNSTFANKIAQLGYKPIEVDVSEFIKAGGGIHCLTNILE